MLANKDGCSPRTPDNWLDIGCEDWYFATENRERIAAHYCGEYWLWLQSALEWIPTGKKLPAYIPQGELPQIRGRDLPQGFTTEGGTDG